jgi:hypothetical protein
MPRLGEKSLRTFYKKKAPLASRRGGFFCPYTHHTACHAARTIFASVKIPSRPRFLAGAEAGHVENVAALMTPFSALRIAGRRAAASSSAPRKPQPARYSHRDSHLGCALSRVTDTQARPGAVERHRDARNTEPYAAALHPSGDFVGDIFAQGARTVLTKLPIFRDSLTCPPHIGPCWMRGFSVLFRHDRPNRGDFSCPGSVIRLSRLSAS